MLGLRSRITSLRLLRIMIKRGLLKAVGRQKKIQMI